MADIDKPEQKIRLLGEYLSLDKQRHTIKHKQEFIYNFKGFDYIICLQYIEELAYILEVEYLGQAEPHYGSGKRERSESGSTFYN